MKSLLVAATAIAVALSVGAWAPTASNQGGNGAVSWVNTGSYGQNDGGGVLPGSGGMVASNSFEHTSSQGTTASKSGPKNLSNGSKTTGTTVTNQYGYGEAFGNVGTVAGYDFAGQTSAVTHAGGWSLGSYTWTKGDR